MTCSATCLSLRAKKRVSIVVYAVFPENNFRDAPISLRSSSMSTAKPSKLLGRRAHHAGSSVNDQVRTSDVRAESTRQEANDSSDLHRKAKSLNTTRMLMLLFPTLPNVNNLGARIRNATRAHAVDPDAGAFQRWHASSYHTKCSMRSDCISWSHALVPSARVRDRAHYDYTAIGTIFRRSICVATSRRHLAHRCGRILEREERRHAVRFEESVKGGWSRSG
jgi:hypothetical protein